MTLSKGAALDSEMAPSVGELASPGMNGLYGKKLTAKMAEAKVTRMRASTKIHIESRDTILREFAGLHAGKIDIAKNIVQAVGTGI